MTSLKFNSFQHAKYAFLCTRFKINYPGCVTSFINAPYEKLLPNVPITLQMISF